MSPSAAGAIGWIIALLVLGISISRPAYYILRSRLFRWRLGRARSAADVMRAIDKWIGIKGERPNGDS